MVQHPWIFAFGILGNIISVMMYLAPLPTFLRVYRKKSTEGFQSIPYVVALFSAMLWIYYATLKSNDFLLLTINSIGCLVETIYIVMFIVYAPKRVRIRTVQLVFLSNFVGFFSIFLLTHFFAKGSIRQHIVGWFCVALSAAVFAAPLSIMRLVIRTKSVEFMPFSLSFSITINAIMWLLYGLLLKDFFITLPNLLGIVFGTIQMILYAIYKNYKAPPQQTDHHDHDPQIDTTTVKLSQLAIVNNTEVSSQPIRNDDDDEVTVRNEETHHHHHHDYKKSSDDHCFEATPTVHAQPSDQCDAV